VRIRLLGPLEVDDGAGRRVDVPGTRLRALLVRLALDPGRPVPGEELIGAVWGSQPPAGASNALQTLVSRLRRTLPGEGVELVAEGYRLAVFAADVDVAEFERLATEGRACRDAGDREAARVLFGRALQLWRGEPLVDLAEADLFGAVIARMVELRLRTFEDLAELELAVGDIALMGELADLAARYPLRERMSALHMRTLAAAGRSAEALVVYESLRRTLAEELGADPSPGVRQMHTAILRGELGSAVPAGAVPAGTARLTNLRAAATSFVGRDGDTARVREILGQARLVTLVGPGGVGKTRLAAEIAAIVAGHYADGAWLVELADIRDPRRLPGVLSGVLGLREAGLSGAGREPASDATAGLAARLRDRHTLLVLDNCEHLIDACARLAQRLLDDCPQVQIMATSREPLGIGGEFLHAVGPLQVPPPDDVDVPGYPAVRLFLDRAAAVRPGFRLTPDNLPSVMEICRRLDGLPLAIELACTRLRSLPAAEIAARLSDRFRLLTGGSRTALPRHQTLLAVVEWSWRLLTDAERVVARRLAVFAGGATLDAAQAVCAGDGVAAGEIVELLGALVDKSFVEMLDVAGGPRYRMLDTIGAFTAVALAEAGEADRVRRAHASYFLAEAECAEPDLRGSAQLETLRRLDSEYGNLAAALRWAVDTAEAATAVRLVAALGWYWLLRNTDDEAAGWLRQVLDLPGADAVVPARMAAAAYAYGTLHHAEADPVRSAAAGAIARKLAGDDEHEWHPAVAFMALILGLQRSDQAARDLVGHPDGWVAAQAELMRGYAAEHRSDVIAAVAHYESAHARFTAVGDRWGIASAATNLATVHGLFGRHRAAIEAAGTALDLAQALGTASDASWMLAQRGLHRLRAGDMAGARDDLTAAGQAAHDSGAAVVSALAQTGLATLARRAGELAVAASLLQDVVAKLDGAGWVEKQVLVHVLTETARTAVEAGDLAAARDRLAGALASATASPAPRAGVAGVGEAMAETVLAGGRPRAAARLLGLAAAVRGAADRGSPDVARTHDRARAGNETAFDEEYAAAAALDAETAYAEIAGQARRR
jgi:predicted ATPase/DNA-binding SARP family transcriptional activator